MTMTTEQFLSDFLEILEDRYSVTPADADIWQIHNAVSGILMGVLSPRVKKSRRAHQNTRRACYFSAEFLVGRAVYNNLLSMGMAKVAYDALQQCGIDLLAMEEIEDAALGNGGLGRLAACYLDSAATMNLPLDGYGIRYRYGLFKQDIVHGNQVETADDWTAHGDAWSRRREGEAVQVKFARQIVNAIPYDMPVVGWKTENVGTLRLWQAESLAPFDFVLFNEQKYDEALRDKNRAEDISRVLYPNDSTHEGRMLRLKQQYFFTCASVTDIVRKYKKYHGPDLSALPDFVTIQLNDTHPVLAIPEFVRQMIEDEDMDFESALALAKRMFNFTNHTIMAEAMEKWPVEMMRELLPYVYEVLELINNALIKDLLHHGVSVEELSKYKVIDDGLIHMARLAVYISRHTNGVAKIHTEILKDTVLKEWYALYPERFTNKTNGVTQRRWLALCNHELSGLLEEKAGGDGFLTDLRELEKLAPLAGDPDTLRRFMEIKRQKKAQLAAFVLQHDGKRLNPSSIFDIQAKRLHEYKRQLMNVFSILFLYFGIKEGKIKDFYPTTFLFAAKSAPGYARAKGVIQFIHQVARLVNDDRDTGGILRVEFLRDYNVSYAEMLAAAADVSIQISTAGTEASGTGNMKLMMNGAVTLGTLDGANVEIAEEAGVENEYIFGAKVEELAEIMPSYNPKRLYENDPELKRVLDTLIDGTFSDDGNGIFRDLYNSLVNGTNWERPDKYYVLGDLRAFAETRIKLNTDYRDDREGFARKCFLNVCHSGKFSSDCAIQDYAEEIWHIQPIRPVR